MSHVLRDQVWRNKRGDHVRVYGVGLCGDPDAHLGEALWVDVCDADGNVTGGRIPVDVGAFREPTWMLTGESA